MTDELRTKLEDANPAEALEISWRIVQGELNGMVDSLIELGEEQESCYENSAALYARLAGYFESKASLFKSASRVIQEAKHES